VHDSEVLAPASNETIPLVKEANTTPIPGYRLLEPLGSGGFGEVWKCEAPGGLTKAIKFVFGNLDSLDADATPAEDELRSLQLVKAIRHPFLLSLERVEVIDGELVIVMELADKSLQNVLDEHKQAGLPGIPRDRLLGYLREAAEALDVMNLQHGLQHLDVKPGNLFLIGNHVKVADFGLVNHRGGPESAGQPCPKLGSLTPLYTSPEVFGGIVSPHSDQYSLAIVYQQLLTQTLPFQGKNARQLLVQHTSDEPNLKPLQAADQPMVARALAKDPARRYPTCTDFIHALIEGDSGRAAPVADVGTAMCCEGLPDYRFLECVSCTPLSEVWKVQAPDGRKRVVQFVYGFARRESEWEAVLRFKALRHRSLRPVELVQCEPGRLVLLTDPVDKNVFDRLHECQARDLLGIPRAELLGYMRVAAETLQQMYSNHSALHLQLNTHTLLLDNGRLLIADMGLAHLLWGPAGQDLARLNDRYSAPELFAGRHDPTSDQYSLALLYQVLLTGVHPFPREAVDAPADERRRLQPNLQPLPKRDRHIIARALHADPQRRWSSCPELVLALTASGSARGGGKQAQSGTATTTQAADDVVVAVRGPLLQGGSLDRPPERDDLVRRRYKARLPLKVIRPRLDAFRLQWHGEVLRDEPSRLVFHVNLPRSFWQRWLGRQSGLEVDVQLAKAKAGAPTEVTVQIEPFGCGRATGVQLVKDIGALLLESLRTYLQVNPERRIQERLIWPYAVVVRGVFDDGRLGEPVEGQGKDISLSGIGFYLPEQLPTTRLRVELTSRRRPPISVPASVARVQRCGESWVEVGALFVPSAGQQKAIVELCAE
jgi:serine/threonine protein kinase